VLYASEVIALLGAYPGREFKMVEIVRYVANGRDMSLREKRTMRKGVLRAIAALNEMGSVLIRPPAPSRGGSASYSWREVRHAVADRHSEVIQEVGH